MKKKRNEDLAEKHLKNLSEESHTIISNQLSDTLLIDSEKEILVKSRVLLKKQSMEPIGWTKSSTKKLFIMHTVAASATH